MRFFRTALVAMVAAGLTTGEEPPQAPPAPEAVNLAQLLDLLRLPEQDENGDTLLTGLARKAQGLPSAARVQLMEPLLIQLLCHGHDPLHENKAGCNAVFYLAGMPDFYQKLAAANRLPRELALRIPHEEGALLRYMRLRNEQALQAKSTGSHEYLTRRYCTPALERAQRMLLNYLGASSLAAIPPGAMGDCLTFMHLASPQAAEGFVNSLTLWEHGEHFLEEIPAEFLSTLHSMGWKVSPVLLRKALHKLGSMLPVSKDDMIECAASAPMAQILEMLTRQEGNAALPELRQYAAAFDPEIVHAALALQMKLRGLPRPWDAGFAALPNPGLVGIRQALVVDAAIRRGRMESLCAAQVLEAAGTIRQHGMPRHADMLEGIVDQGAIILRPELRPAFRTRYEEIKEDSPHVALLRYLLEHEELLKPGEASP